MATAAAVSHHSREWTSQNQQYTHQHASTRASSSSAAASSSSSASRKHADMYDRFYGHREISELSESVISALFACPLDSASSSVNAQIITTQDGVARPTPRLAEFIAYALHRTRLPEEITFQALFLLRRLKCRFPAARGSSGHRLFVSALMLASKSSCDDTYSNKSWTIVSQGLFSLREVNQMERELFGYLGYKVNVEYEELDAFTQLLKAGEIMALVEMGSNSVPPSPVVQDNVADVDTTPTKTVAAQATAGYPSMRVPNGYVANPAYGMQQLQPNAAHASVGASHLSPSINSMSSSRGSISSSSAYSMVPSPTALSQSESSNSSRASPDTPPSDFDASPWTDDCKATFSGEPAGTYDDQYNFYHRIKHQQQPQYYHPHVGGATSTGPHHIVYGADGSIRQAYTSH